MFISTVFRLRLKKKSIWNCAWPPDRIHLSMKTPMSFPVTMKIECLKDGNVGRHYFGIKRCYPCYSTTYLEGQSVDHHVGPQLGVAAGLSGIHRQRELLVEHLQQLLRSDGLLQHPHAQVRLVLHHLEYQLHSNIMMKLLYCHCTK